MRAGGGHGLRVTIPRVAGLLSAALGLAVLLSWALDVPSIKSVLPGAVEMKANTAVGLLLAGVSLCLLDGQPSNRRKGIGQALALGVALLGFATASEYAFGWDLAIDELLFRDTTEAYNPFRGRMSPNSAVVFALFGLGLAALPRPSLRWLVWMAAMLTLLVGGVSFVGYIWNASELVTDRFVPPVAIHTAAAFILLAVGMLTVGRPGAERAAGIRASLSSIERKTLLGFLATLFLLLLAGGATYRAASQAAESVRWVLHTQQVLSSLGRLYADVSDAESHQRNYILSSHPDYLEDYQRQVRDAERQAEALTHAVADHPAQLQRMKEIQAAIRERMAVLERSRTTFETSGLAAAQELIRGGEGRRLKETIRASISTMNSVEEDLLALREADAARDRVELLLFLLATLAAAVTGFIVLFNTIRRELSIRTEVEESHRRSEENLAVTLNSIGDGVLATDTSGHLTWINPVAEKLTGWTQATAQGRPIGEVFRIINEHTRQPAIIPVDQVLATGEIQGLANHTVLLARDGTEYPIADSAAPIRDQHGRILGVVLVFRDVSAEHAAQKALRASEARYRTLFDSIDEGFCIIEMIFDELEKPVDYRFIEINPSFAKQTGLRDALGKTMLELAPQHEAYWFDTLGRIATTGEPARFQNHAAQLHRTFDVYAFRFGEPENRQVAILFSDITRSKEAELEIKQLNESLEQRVQERTAELAQAMDSLSHSEHRFRALIEHSSDSISVIDANNKILYLSPSVVTVEGYAAHELIGRRGTENTHPDDLPLIHETVEKLLANPGKPFLVLWRRRHKNGHWLWLEGVAVNLLDDPAIGGIVTNYRDVTERKQAEDLLHEASARYQALIAASNTGAWEFHYDSGFLWCSPEYFSMLGRQIDDYDLSGGANLKETWIDLLHPEDRERASRHFANYVRSPKGTYENHFRLRHRDEHWVWIWSRGRTLKDEAGNLTAVTIGTHIDITEHKQAEEHIQALNADLERRVQERTHELKESNKELEAFSYSVSHDLRAPLRHVHGYVEMLVHETAGQLSPKAARYLQIIKDASVEMGHLIDDLLAFSRMSRTEMQEDVVDLNEMVQGSLRGLEMLTKERNIAWKIAPLPPVTGDPAMLRQVFSNLIGNAVKYSRQRDPAEIEIGCMGEEAGRNIFFVRDNGAGFDMTYAHKLFGVFQRLHRADEFEGTGIGLATVRRILTRHGDRVWAEGEPGKGATFYFTLKPANGE